MPDLTPAERTALLTTRRATAALACDCASLVGEGDRCDRCHELEQIDRCLDGEGPDDDA
jgi:hypothetical protein